MQMSSFNRRLDSSSPSSCGRGRDDRHLQGSQHRGAPIGATWRRLLGDVGVAAIRRFGRSDVTRDRLGRPLAVAMGDVV